MKKKAVQKKRAKANVLNAALAAAGVDAARAREHLGALKTAAPEGIPEEQLIAWVNENFPNPQGVLIALGREWEKE